MANPIPDDAPMPQEPARAPRWDAKAAARMGEMLASEAVACARLDAAGWRAGAGSRRDFEALLAVFDLAGADAMERAATLALGKALALPAGPEGPARREGALWTLARLAAAGARLDAKEGDVTPLARQAELGSAEVVESLLALGADPALECSPLGLPEVWAAGKPEVAAMLAAARQAQAGQDYADLWLLRCNISVEGRSGESPDRWLCFAAPKALVAAWDGLAIDAMTARALSAEGPLAPLGRTAICARLFKQWSGSCKSASALEPVLWRGGDEGGLGFRRMATQRLSIALAPGAPEPGEEQWGGLARAFAAQIGSREWADMGTAPEKLLGGRQASPGGSRMMGMEERDQARCLAQRARVALERSALGAHAGAGSPKTRPKAL